MENHEHTHPEVPPGTHPEVWEQRRDPMFRRWWVGGWLSPILVAGGTLIWCFLIYLLIGTRPTDWKYGTMPYVPGQSPFSIESTIRTEIPPQQVELPEEEPGARNENR